ncbi:hypothetical protein AB6A40_007315 [Gnathostoma spinigerum]|uniref:Small ribosomal subunit protein mS26 n=1 Tax=Gnathostoma spinigerum TaxID=75299 RepID=A0ABD6ET24_9BILA
MYFTYKPCTRTVLFNGSTFRYFRRKPPKPGKPPIEPPAKRVLYHVTHAPWMKPEDVKELLWRRHVYNNAIESIKKVFKQELDRRQALGLGIAAMKEQEEQEFERLLEENNQRNAELARDRERRHEEEIVNIERTILEEIDAELAKRKEVAMECSKKVEDMIERSKNFVTYENLDEKIKEALENPVVYDFAIDLNGNRQYLAKPVKYLEGVPTRQKGRMYDKTVALQG